MPRLNGTIDFDDVASAKSASASWWDEQDFDKVYIQGFGIYDFEASVAETPDDDNVIEIADGYLVKVAAIGGAWLDVLETVQPTPAPTGNIANLNSIFKDSNGDTWVVDNNGDAILAASTTQPSTVVLDNSITDPSSITDAGRYIVPATGAVGVFVGHANQYADFDGTTLVFSTPAEGARVNITTGVNAGNVYRYSAGAWAQITTTVNDFWRARAAETTLPNGTNDLTKDIRRNGRTGLNVDPLSNFDNDGSLGLAGKNVATVNYTGSSTDAIAYLNSATTQTFTLPSPTTANRRIYTIVNTAAIAKVITSYTTLAGVSSTVIPAQSSLVLQANGGVWKQILGGGKQYESGDVIQTKIYRHFEISGTFAAFYGGTQFNPNKTFTPKSTSSRIIVEVDMDYAIGGSGGEEWRAILREGTTSIYEKRQRSDAGGGGGTRSSVLLPIMGSYDNTTLTPKSFNIVIARVSGDDSMTVYTQRNFKITEVQN